MGVNSVWVQCIHLLPGGSGQTTGQSGRQPEAVWKSGAFLEKMGSESAKDSLGLKLKPATVRDRTSYSLVRVSKLLWLVTPPGKACTARAWANTTTRVCRGVTVRAGGGAWMLGRPAHMVDTRLDCWEFGHHPAWDLGPRFLRGGRMETRPFSLLLLTLLGGGAQAFLGQRALETTWRGRVPAPFPAWTEAEAGETGAALHGPASPGAWIYWRAGGWRDRMQALSQRAACGRKSGAELIGHLSTQTAKDTWSRTVTRDPLSHLEGSAAAACIPQQMAFLNGRRNSGYGLGVVWPDRGWQGSFLWSFKGNEL